MHRARLEGKLDVALCTVLHRLLLGWHQRSASIAVGWRQHGEGVDHGGSNSDSAAADALARERHRAVQAEARVDRAEARLDRAEERAAEDRQQLRVERERTAAAEGQVNVLRRVVDTDLPALRAELMVVQTAGIPVRAVSAESEPRTRRQPRRPAWRRWLGL